MGRLKEPCETARIQTWYERVASNAKHDSAKLASPGRQSREIKTEQTEKKKVRDREGKTKTTKKPTLNNKITKGIKDSAKKWKKEMKKKLKTHDSNQRIS